MSMAGTGLLIVLSNSVSLRPHWSNQLCFEPHILTWSVSHLDVSNIMANTYFE